MFSRLHGESLACGSLFPRYHVQAFPTILPKRTINGSCIDQHGTVKWYSVIRLQTCVVVVLLAAYLHAAELDVLYKTDCVNLSVSQGLQSSLTHPENHAHMAFLSPTIFAKISGLRRQKVNCVSGVTVYAILMKQLTKLINQYIFR